MWVANRLWRIQGDSGQGKASNAHKKIVAAWNEDDKWWFYGIEKWGINVRGRHLPEGGHIFMDTGRVDWGDDDGYDPADTRMRADIFQ